MQTVVGTFRSRAAAEQSLKAILDMGIPPQSIIFLSGEQSVPGVATVPTTDAEAEGMGKAVGAVVGGAAGIGAGLSLGAAAASLIVPGVGTILAAGMGAAAALGLGGAVAGAKVGEATEHSMDEGVPKDDVFLYRELLKHGHSLLIVITDSGEEATTARSAMDRYGSEDIAAARKEWRRVA